jgi:hypothetical protein
VDYASVKFGFEGSLEVALVWILFKGCRGLLRESNIVVYLFCAGHDSLIQATRSFGKYREEDLASWSA